MIKNLLILSLVLMFISWLSYFFVSFIDFKVYSLVVDVNSNAIAQRIYRDIQEYIKSMDENSKKYIELSEIKNEEKVVVNEDYSKLVLAVREKKEFLSKKLKPRMIQKGYSINIIPHYDGVYFAYLSNYVFVPRSQLTENDLKTINDKYVGFLLNDQLIDYINFLNSYFTKNDSERIAKNQFFISKNFLINFTLSPFTTSKVLNLTTFRIDNISKKEYLLNIQKIIDKYKTGSVYLNINQNEKLINLQALNKRERKK